ncbi:MAG TPA: peptidoglycan editing factor PgeF [Candidatus Angelobacter sp.]|nr:peptidoglycan editing factor PgeF [Candidatus Angelobacter sp.]
MIQADALKDSPRIRHGFFTRQGGVSAGLYASLNCGYGSNDDPGNVTENRRRALALIGMPPEVLATTYQIHSADVVEVTKPWPLDSRPRVDAMVTTRPGVALGIGTADCAPVLLADPVAGVIGAAHAGWRGAVTGVVEAVVRSMVERGAEPARMRAAVGPCIAQASYEVGPEFPQPFLQQDPENRRFFVPSKRAGHFMFDLPSYVVSRLRRLGIAEAASVARDTCAEADMFFSYRRTTLAGEKDYGRGLSVIALTE